MRALVLYSSYSGNGRFLKKLDYIADTLKTKYDIVDFHKSLYKGSFSDHILKKGFKYDLILCVGGDGSVHEVVNAIMQLEKRPTLAYIPAGTCNDSARSLGLKRNLRKTLKTILECNTAKIDVFKINDAYFYYGLAAGCLTEISYDTKRELKKGIGKFGYYIQGLKSYMDTKTISFELETSDGTIIDGEFSLFLALNTRYLAGFKVHRKRRIYLNDQKIRITLIRKTNKFMNVIDFGMFLIFGEAYKHNMMYFDASSFKITSVQGIAYNTDGEMFDKHNFLNVSVVPSAIELITSKRVLRRHFIK